MLMFFSYSYDSITSINNALINSTNIHNQYAIFTLFIYFKSLLEYNQSLTNSKLIFDYTVFEKASELLVQDEDSVSLPRLFWFYYSYYNLVLQGNLKWFIAQIVNKNFDKFAYHWSFTIRQVYYKFLIFCGTSNSNNLLDTFLSTLFVRTFLSVFFLHYLSIY